MRKNKQHIKEILFCLLSVIVMVGIGILALYQAPPLVSTDTQGGQMIDDLEHYVLNRDTVVMPCENTYKTFWEYCEVDLNHATVEQLCLLKGIGERKAKAIVAYRTFHRAFTSVEDVVQVSGITQRNVIEWGEQAYVSPFGK